jgi:hypothetical protein
MESEVVHQSSKNELTKGSIETQLDTFFMGFQKKDHQVAVVYYTGHGERGSGDWCITSSASLSLDDILNCWDQLKNASQGITHYQHQNNLVYEIIQRFVVMCSKVYCYLLRIAAMLVNGLSN